MSNLIENFLNKRKQILLITAKFILVGLAFFYIYNKLQSDETIDFSAVFHYISVVSIFYLLLFSVANWFFEVLKWQNLVNSFQKISFFQALQQTLGSLTASIFTPNRIGEYGVKVLYFKKENAKQIVFLNFVHNSSQMLVTTVFGFLGFLMTLFAKTETMFWVGFKLSALKLFLFVLGFLVLVFLFLRLKKVEIYGFSIQKLIQKIRQIKRETFVKTLLFSVIRYLIFSCQFYFLMLLFDADIDIYNAFSTIFIMYFVASVLPSIHFFDVVIKGSVAVYLFSKFGIEDLKILTITSLMWLFNLVLPLIAGSLFILNFKLDKK